jgi:4-carboxymuconolactone decarboxylase
MARLANLSADELNEEQRRVAAAIGSSRSGHIGGPFAIWLRVPEMAERFNHVSDRIRTNSPFEPRLLELMILVVAREYSAQYEWQTHRELAETAGVDVAIIEAIRHRRTPTFLETDEVIIFDTVGELARTGKLSDAAYERARDFFGLELLIELITTASFYAMIAMVLNAFDVPVAGELPLPI